MLNMMNNREWTDEQKYRIVEIDTQERKRGKNFMKRIKSRWEGEYPASRRTAQNLVDNARRFRNEGWGSAIDLGNENGAAEQAQAAVTAGSERKSLEWTTDMKVLLVMLDEEERAKGRGFMKRVKERWDVKYPEYQSASWQKLRDNAARFKKEQEIKNLILVRRREEVQIAEVAAENNLEALDEIDPPLNNGEGEEEVIDVEEVDIQIDEDFSEEDKELKRYFQTELEKMNHCTTLHMESREKLPKVVLTAEIQDRANKILEMYLENVDTLPEIIDIVYAMGKAVGYATGVKPKDGVENRAGRADGGNRRERKLKADMRSLRKDIARAGNELHRRKQRRRATKKEKQILKELKTKMEKETTSQNLRAAKEVWLDKLRYKKVKLEKCVEKRWRKLDNLMFQRDQKNFFRTLEADDKKEGEMPEMEKFVEFWGGIWEHNKSTPNKPWMEEVKRELSEKALIITEFRITDENLRREVAKRKNWTAPGIDGIQNFWWKKFEPAQKALRRALGEIYENTAMIPEWWPSGRTVMPPKTKDLSDEKNYRPITCLNTSYKILTGLVAKYMREHTLENEIWDER
jgi:hypothetical protein